MYKADILLTEEEGSDALSKGYAVAEKNSTTEDNTDKTLECILAARKERDKAQCRKLLEWLDAPCNIEEHHVCEAALGWPRQNCRFCMYEIRKLLKEQND